MATNTMPWHGIAGHNKLRKLEREDIECFFKCFGWEKVFLGTERRLRTYFLGLGGGWDQLWRNIALFLNWPWPCFPIINYSPCLHLLLCACLDFCTKLYPYHTPPIQEEETVRENTARGPKGRGQYFPVLSPPLGLGGYGTDIS